MSRMSVGRGDAGGCCDRRRTSCRSRSQVVRAAVERAAGPMLLRGLEMVEAELDTAVMTSRDRRGFLTLDRTLVAVHRRLLRRAPTIVSA
jgi:hypothetical protein